ncbi:MDR family NADP-dependent oxidoreductase [Kitasatospora sp. NPDC089509]|uniref:MDR family NADP-dependent oxidoreductase n=1 Tax=Kitasatospora sp. NPDC089509 TaxID=3364079 RepID=UPI00380797BC
MTETPRTTSREVRLAARPTGLPGPEHFTLVTTPRPVPAAGEVLVRNRFFLIASSLRMMISEGAEDVHGVPFPALRPGDTLGATTLGEVVLAPADSGLTPGDLLVHRRGWREYAAVPVADCERLDAGPADPVEAALGHGWTAYAALTRALRVGPGDTVFITGASGAIGSMAGQIARRLGAGRVVGSAGSAAKAERLVEEFGYDAVVVRGAGPVVEQLAAAAPDGIDKCLDLVGGEQLSAAVAVANHGARIAVMGSLSGQLAATGTGRTAPVSLDSVQLLLKRITLVGYSADDDPQAQPEWARTYREWREAGLISFPHQRIAGIENAVQAQLDTAAGRYLGAVVVAL